MVAKKQIKDAKTEFIRSYLDSVPAKDIVEAAKKVGIQITTEYVHKIRSRSTPKTPATTTVLASEECMTAEQAICNAAAELGYIRALDVLDDWVRGLRARRGVK
jgi:CHAD domain-containing protein